MEQAEFESLLGGIVAREIEGCSGLKSAERLSGGASQETYRLTLATDGGERVVCTLLLGALILSFLQDTAETRIYPQPPPPTTQPRGR